VFRIFVSSVPVCIALGFSTAAAAQSGDLEYVSNGELKAEIVEREEDMKRTEARLADIGEQEKTAEAELVNAQQDFHVLEKLSTARVRAFYCMSRNAGTIRFLLNASSPIDAIRRMYMLRKLLIDGLDAHRQAGLRIAEAEKKVSRLKEDKEAAHAMFGMLSEAYQTRLAEARARRIPIHRHKRLLSMK
jgi:peptidoglycan hydrolase CwlO-like protein